MALIDPNLPRVFQAYCPKGSGPSRETPLQAVKALLERYPGSRKVSVQEFTKTEDDTLTMVLASKDWMSWREMPTKVALVTLPDKTAAEIRAVTV